MQRAGFWNDPILGGRVFERFNEEAWRCLFFARYKTAERSGDATTDADLLHGISLGGPGAIELLDAAADALRSPESAEQFMTRIDRDHEASAHNRKEIPFSAAARSALQFAIAEADSLRHTSIGPEHLLLGLLRDDTTDAWRRLLEAGVRPLIFGYV